MMKKLLAILLCLALLLSTAACSADDPQVSQPTEAPQSAGPVITEEVKAQMDAVLEKYDYEGIVNLTHDGEVVYQWVSGTNDVGDPLTMESPMYICSISKQFCAAAVLMLRDQGKLSLDDTLEKYFPEYTIGKDITLQNLLSMRSGITQNVDPILEDPEQYAQMSPEDINAEMMGWIFSQPLRFEQGTKFEYSNVNYNLLSYVVEQVSGQRYEDFIRQNIFEPLGMTHSGFRNEVPEHPEWGLTYEKLNLGSVLGDMIQGCGDIVTTAADLDIWMTALQSGKVVCEESYQEMTTNYSPDKLNPYGYGLMEDLRGGLGHTGGDGGYTSRMYFNEEYGYNFYIVTGNTPVIASGAMKYASGLTGEVSVEFLRILFTATDAAVSK